MGINWNVVRSLTSKVGLLIERKAYTKHSMTTIYKDKDLFMSQVTAFTISIMIADILISSLFRFVISIFVKSKIKWRNFIIVKLRLGSGTQALSGSLRLKLRLSDSGSVTE